MIDNRKRKTMWVGSTFTKLKATGQSLVLLGFLPIDGGNPAAAQPLNLKARNFRPGPYLTRTIFRSATPSSVCRR